MCLASTDDDDDNLLHHELKLFKNGFVVVQVIIITSVELLFSVTYYATAVYLSICAIETLLVISIMHVLLSAILTIQLHDYNQLLLTLLMTLIACNYSNSNSLIIVRKYCHHFK